MTAFVEARGLTIPGRLDETALTLSAGQLTCLIGPNGSGKTSLLHALAGIGSRTGEVRIEGIDPQHLAPAERQRFLSYLPASRDVNWPLRATDLIALGSSRREPEHQAELMAALQLDLFADRTVDRLSTGERSRVLIARALLARPKLLLLDEPVSNLDPLWQLRLMDYLRSLAREYRPALLVAMHDLELARSYADRLIIMNFGKVEADGSPAELLDSSHIPEVFGVKFEDGRWRPLS